MYLKRSVLLLLLSSFLTGCSAFGLLKTAGTVTTSAAKIISGTPNPPIPTVTAQIGKENISKSANVSGIGNAVKRNSAVQGAFTFNADTAKEVQSTVSSSTLHKAYKGTQEISGVNTNSLVVNNNNPTYSIIAFLLGIVVGTLLSLMYRLIKRKKLNNNKQT